MRVSLTNPTQLLNSKTRYPRKAFVRVLEEGEEVDESRLSGLNVIKTFLLKYKNNKFETKVFIEEPGWDMTPTDKEILKADHFLVYPEIVKLIGQVHHDVNNSWANANPTAAECYFTEGHIPFEGTRDLGFPEGKVMKQGPK